MQEWNPGNGANMYPCRDSLLFYLERSQMAEVTGVNEVIDGIKRYRLAVEAAVQIAASIVAEELQDYAKQNHPWQNRTGDTEATTISFIQEVQKDMVRIILTTGTDYSLFLETIKNGRWAWLWPTMLANKDNIRDILALQIAEVTR